ncbi:isotrichodermin c-15 hydroxylase [Diaporthe amygdali]|uniref:isotrichodermin c-15 hydroxylase n=1 Tax=Phomopsis amygdali TaxID=1214568 RepID=UPI0022FE58C5|nr:isotrichodermin c-15 hydroxylase [Diaporthe amygdali]KAJ0122747.1 isotrichodermin c-15 hydroxylase [Diaporthe amygdali]
MVSQVRGTIHFKMLEFHQQYGPVVRLAPGELTYTTATAVKEIYGNRNGRKLMPPQSSLGSNEKTMFGATSFIWLESHKEHSRHRKILSQGFSDASLKAQEPMVVGYATLLIQRLRERASKGEVIDMWAWFNYYTFDIIGDLVFGESFGCVDQGQFHPWISFIFSNLTNMMYAQMITTMGYLGSFIQALVPERVMAQAIAHAQSTRDKVDRRLARKDVRPDLISGMMHRIGAEGGISREELYADAQIMIMAGSETSATLLAVAVYHLLRNPGALARLQSEIRGAFAGEEAELAFAAVSKLPYLRAVIDESLRIHPPLPAGINRVVPEGGAVIDGHFVPEGTVLQVPGWAAFHLEENFKDPWEFVPERWLGESCPARYAGENHDVFTPFSYGQRSCLGRSLASMETRVCLARLILGFDMELMEDSHDWNQQKVYLLYEKRPLNVKLTEVIKSEKDVLVSCVLDRNSEKL